MTSPDPSVLSPVDRPRARPLELAVLWWRDALTLMFRASTPLALIAGGATIFDLLVIWLRATLPGAEIGLVLISSATAPIWLTAMIVGLRYADLGPASLKVPMPQIQAMCGRMFLVLPGILIGMGVLMMLAPQQDPLWAYASLNWTMLVLVGLLSFKNRFGACLLAGYHRKSAQDAGDLAAMGWKISGMVSLMTTLTIVSLAWSGAASALPSPGSVFSSAFLTVILAGVQYVGNVDIFEQRKLGQTG